MCERKAISRNKTKENQHSESKTTCSGDSGGDRVANGNVSVVTCAQVSGSHARPSSSSRSSACETGLERRLLAPPTLPEFPKRSFATFATVGLLSEPRADLATDSGCGLRERVGSRPKSLRNRRMQSGHIQELGDSLMSRVSDIHRLIVAGCVPDLIKLSLTELQVPGKCCFS